MTVECYLNLLKFAVTLLLLLIKMPTTFVLVIWIEEENLSVLPESASRTGKREYLGAIGEFKWCGNYYEGETLGISTKYLKLVKLSK